MAEDLENLKLADDEPLTEEMLEMLLDRYERGYTTEDVLLNKALEKFGLPVKVRGENIEYTRRGKGNLRVNVSPKAKGVSLQYTREFANGGPIAQGIAEADAKLSPEQELWVASLLDPTDERMQGEEFFPTIQPPMAGFRTPLQQRTENIDIFNDPYVEDGIPDANIRPRYSNRPSFNPETALGTPDPAFNRGLAGFIGQDPAATAKGLAIAPFTMGPDLVGMLQAGGNYLAGTRDQGQFSEYFNQGDEPTNFKPFGEPISGNPLRELAGLDPSNPQAMLGEIASPMATMAKILGVTVKSAIAGAKLAAGTGFDPSLAMTLFHGGPHKFNKFSLAKIGSGEGVQAFGHGLYFSMLKGIANTYASVGRTLKYKGLKVPTSPVTYHGQWTSFSGDKSLDEVLGAYAIADDMSNPESVKKILQDRRRNLHSPDFDEYQDRAANLDEALRRFDEHSKHIEGKVDGYNYEIEIPDDLTARMLDWDAPISEQSEHIQKFFSDAGLHDLEGQIKLTRVNDELAEIAETRATVDNSITSWKPDRSANTQQIDASNTRYRNLLEEDLDLERRTHQLHAERKNLIANLEQEGGVAYNRLARKGVSRQQWRDSLFDVFSDPAAASATLNEAGIPGIRYKAGQMSALPRGMPDTSNIVLFNPDDIISVKRDGVLVHERATDIEAAAAAEKELRRINLEQVDDVREAVPDGGIETLLKKKSAQQEFDF